MADRVVLNEQEAQEVVGGKLSWDFSNCTVHPKGNDSALFGFTNYDDCKAWLVVNWDSIQDESCLVAMEQAGLVHRL